jgi:GT2 family glycosyltransferase
MNQEPLVSVIILNYNAGELLLNCVESIRKSTYNNLEIIVVDNVSSDGSQTRCKEEYPDVRLIQNKENLGYCEGNNVGIRKANGKFIVVINPDTEVSPTWLHELLNAQKKLGEGIFQPKILSLKEKDILQSTGNMIHLFGIGFSRDLGIIDSGKHDTVERVGYAAGTCFFTSAEVFKKVGLFDPFIFLYHDDLDFGWRAAQIGIKSFYIPTSKIFHVKSYNLKWSSKKFFWLERNRKYCIQTHYSKDTLLKMKLELILSEIIIWAAYISKGFLIAKIKANLDISRNKDQIKKKYVELEKKKIIDDKELIKIFPDNVFLSNNISQGWGSQFFNKFISKLSKNAKQKIQS